MKTSISYRRVWDIAFPIMIGSVAQNVINVTDTAFLGSLGDVALGGGAIGGLFYLAIIMLGWGVGVGAQIMVARRFGEGKNKEIGSIIEHTQYFLLFLAVILIVLFELFGKTILYSIVESESVFNASYEFLRYRIWGLFFAFTYFSYRAFYVGIGKTKVITYTTLTMVIVNVFFGYSLVFGHFGFPKMGVSGAGLASVIAEFSGAGAFIVYTILNKNIKEFHIFKFYRYDSEMMSRIFKVSIPLMLQNFFSFSIWFIFFLIIEKMGEVELAASNIIRSIYVVLLIPIMGFATAANSLVSFVIGQGRSKEVLSLTWRIALVAAGFSVVLSVICSMFPRLIIQVYTNDPSIIEMALPIMHIITIASVLLAMGFVLFNSVSGTGKTNISLLLEIGILAIYILLTFVFALVFMQPLTVVWTVEILYGILLSSVSFIYLRSDHWVGKMI
ncbi:MAG: MATE family efflux transporter [Bacteroidales bacterium]|nr:MAG: MATE family efflux transporter [Bacteroidales bacterium]